MMSAWRRGKYWLEKDIRQLRREGNNYGVNISTPFDVSSHPNRTIPHHPIDLHSQSNRAHHDARPSDWPGTNDPSKLP
jgi:hypothetical protein